MDQQMYCRVDISANNAEAAVFINLSIAVEHPRVDGKPNVGQFIWQGPRFDFLA